MFWQAVANLAQHERDQMQGTVIWYDAELRVALIQRNDGFTVGTAERGELACGMIVAGNLRTPGLSQLSEVTTGAVVDFAVEADAPTEEQANELLGFVRD